MSGEWQDPPTTASGWPAPSGPPAYAPAPPPAAAGPPVVAEPDPGFNHFLRFLGVYLMVSVAMAVVVGWFWMGHILNRVGHRKRDLLLMLVPIVGNVIQVRVLWRYTARTIYWSPRPDRPPDLLRGWQRPWAIGGGYVAFPAMIALFIAAALAEQEWTEDDRQDLIAEFDDRYDRATAACIADEIIEDFPDRTDWEFADTIDIANSVDRARLACNVPR